MFGTARGLCYPVKVVTIASGTGTATGEGIISISAGAVSTTCYITVSSGTNIGTLIGTA